MRFGAFNPSAFLPVVRRSSLRALLCITLTMWAGIDSQAVSIASGSTSSVTHNRSSSDQQQDGDVDDCMVDLTRLAVAGRGCQTFAVPSATEAGLSILVGPPNCAICYHRQPRTAPTGGEHAFHNGVGAPLLC